MKSRHSGLVVTALLALTVAGCQDSSAPTVNCGVAGTANVEVTGDLRVDVDDCATYTISRSPSTHMMISLTAGSLAAPTHTIVLMHAGERPVPGMYSVEGATENTFWGMFTVHNSNVADRAFIIEAGQVEITSSSAEALSGNLSITAEDANGKSVLLSGSFTAKCVDTATTDC